MISFRRRPFILRPERVGFHKWTDVLKRLSLDRVGSLSWFENFVTQMTLNGDTVGVKFNFDVDVGNSMDSLRILAWAASCESGKQEELALALAHNHFELGKCVARPDNLLEAVGMVGLDRVEAQKVIDSDMFEDQVLRDFEKSSLEDVHSIPVFIFRNEDGKEFRVCGAAKQEEYESIILNLVT